jgi:hypothetical protein
VRLEHILGQIQAAAKLCYGWSPSVGLLNSRLWHSDAIRRADGHSHGTNRLPPRSDPHQATNAGSVAMVGTADTTVSVACGDGEESSATPLGCCWEEKLRGFGRWGAAVRLPCQASWATRTVTGSRSAGTAWSRPLGRRWAGIPQMCTGAEFIRAGRVGNTTRPGSRCP